LNTPSKKNRLQNLDAMRGLAALMVCFYHFGRGLPDGSIKDACTYGNLGVDIFFVISGFVIPLWLDRTGGGWGQIPLFLWKRFIRLYPAYLFASLCGLVLWWGSGHFPGFRGEPVGISGTAVFANLFFLCDIVGQPWVVPVSWSLAIEWQFYLAVAVSF
jgi:peptidoglycan/LPS O-acetylase OafA/YrhL